jgi:hypothetical protein
MVNWIIGKAAITFQLRYFVQYAYLVEDATKKKTDTSRGKENKKGDIVPVRVLQGYPTQQMSQQFARFHYSTAAEPGSYLEDKQSLCQ